MTETNHSENKKVHVSKQQSSTLPSTPETTPLDIAISIPPSPSEAMSWSKTLLVISYNVFFLVVPSLLVCLYYGDSDFLNTDPVARALVFSALLGMSTGSIHSLASTAVHSSRGFLGASWLIFYLCRPLIGGGVALVTCLVLMSGVGGFEVAPGSKDLILFAWAALAGMYSQPALEKLKEVFATLFATKEKKVDSKEGQPGK